MAGTEIWLVEADGTNTVKLITGAGVNDNKTYVQNDAAVYYKQTGLHNIAQEAGVLPGPSGSAKNLRRDSVYQMIAVPISPARASTSSVNGTTAPLVLATPQRSNTKSPKVIATPVRMDVHSWSPSPRGKRNVDLDTDYSDSKRRRGERNGKGLRQFSMRVCDKVQRKGITTYNEVADELVAEFSDPSCSSPDQGYDHKNIRRRVYDALNVLMAMNIISKEKKEIRWIGLPTNSEQECSVLEAEKKRRLERVNSKLQQLQELLLQQIAFKHLVERNRASEKERGSPPAPNTIIQLPYIVVHTDKKTVIDCSISSDKSEYLFNFDKPFEIHDDIEVLRRMGMMMGLENGQCGQEDVRKALRMVPEALEHYVLQLANGIRNIEGLGLGRQDSTARSSRGLRRLTGSPVTGASGNCYDNLDYEVARVMRGTPSRLSDYSTSIRESPDADEYGDMTDEDDDDDN